jgi:hypothetical protein
MPQNPLVLLVERIHGTPCESDPPLQFPGVGGQLDVLPRGALHLMTSSADREPGGGTQVTMACDAVGPLKYTRLHVFQAEVGHRVSARLVQQHHVFTVGDPLASEPDTQPPAKTLGEQQSLGQRIGSQESPDRACRERTLLP